VSGIQDHDLDYLCRQSARLVTKLCAENDALRIRCQALEATVERLHAMLRDPDHDSMPAIGTGAP
jgi:hypothetical protein